MGSSEQPTPGCDLIEEIRSAFRMLDRNEDGRIEAAELEAVVRALRLEAISHDEVERMIREADIDGNGTVEWDEFLRLMKRYLKRRAANDEDEEFREAFTVFDHDGNGFIDREELKLTMSRLGEQLSDADVNAMLSLADEDGDGRINFREFKKMMCMRRNGETGANHSNANANSNAGGASHSNSCSTPLSGGGGSKSRAHEAAGSNGGTGTGNSTPVRTKRRDKADAASSKKSPLRTPPSAPLLTSVSPTATAKK